MKRKITNSKVFILTIALSSIWHAYLTINNWFTLQFKHKFHKLSWTTIIIWSQLLSHLCASNILQLKNPAQQPTQSNQIMAKKILIQRCLNKGWNTHFLTKLLSLLPHILAYILVNLPLKASTKPSSHLHIIVMLAPTLSNYTTMVIYNMLLHLWSRPGLPLTMLASHVIWW